METFYLGTHLEAWLGRLDVPLFVNHNRLAKRRTYPRATTRWALDSGAFTELQRHGKWTTAPEDYARAVERYQEQIGGLDFAAPQDWICDPIVREGGRTPMMEFAGTGATVGEHVERTVDNFARLRELAPAVPWAPVLQGWELDDYRRCAEGYEAVGVDLRAEPVVMVGSLVSRQATGTADVIVKTFHDAGYRLHGLGIKPEGLTAYGRWLTSADSTAWSREARSRRTKLTGCAHVGDCRNCARYALYWRTRALEAVEHEQGRMLI